jgi:hypothetical protein
MTERITIIDFVEKYVGKYSKNPFLWEKNLDTNQWEPTTYKETLVKAKGYEDCIAIISENAVSVIVGAEALQAAEAAQIFAIVYDTTGISPENISIMNRA